MFENEVKYRILKTGLKSALLQNQLEGEEYLNILKVLQKN